MEKKIIRLNEKELTQFISKSVKTILKEAKKKEKMELLKIPGSEYWDDAKKQRMLVSFGAKYNFNPNEARWVADTISYKKITNIKKLDGESDQDYIKRVMEVNPDFKKELEQYKDEEWRPINTTYGGGKISYSDEKYLVSQYGRVMILNYGNSGDCKIKLGTKREGGVNRYAIDLSGKRGDNAYVDDPEGELTQKEHFHSNDNVGNLVAHAFIGPRPEGARLKYKDGNPFNNRADNLYWG